MTSVLPTNVAEFVSLASSDNAEKRPSAEDPTSDACGTLQIFRPCCCKKWICRLIARLIFLEEYERNSGSGRVALVGVGKGNLGAYP